MIVFGGPVEERQSFCHVLVLDVFWWVPVIQVQFEMVLMSTPWKMNMEPTNRPFGKENDLPTLDDDVPCYSSRV